MARGKLKDSLQKVCDILKEGLGTSLQHSKMAQTAADLLAMIFHTIKHLESNVPLQREGSQDKPIEK